MGRQLGKFLNSHYTTLREKWHTTRAHCLKIAQNVAFEFLNFPPIFVILKLTCLVTLFDCEL